MEFPIITTDIISIDSSKIKDCNDNSKFVIIYGENCLSFQISKLINFIEYLFSF